MTLKPDHEVEFGFVCKLPKPCLHCDLDQDSWQDTNAELLDSVRVSIAKGMDPDLEHLGLSRTLYGSWVR